MNESKYEYHHFMKIKSAVVPYRLTFLLLVLCSIFNVSGVLAQDSSLGLRLSAGSSFQLRNDVQIPNDESGTRFSLADSVGEGPVNAVRLEALWSIKERHGIRVMLAPLSYTEATTFATSVSFEGELFNAQDSIDAGYRFNSWRIGYFYTWKSNNRTTVRLGGTLKVRDAEIRLEQGNTVAFNDDIGLVPLLYLSGRWAVSNRWTFGADIDALGGGPGRAIDLGLTLDYALSRRWNLGIDLRVLDGGADIDELFNFATFTSAAVALSRGL
jgi:hypothetical protein